jgi:serine/threonine protein kinase
MVADPLLQTRVGNVRLVRKLGAGAMGVVYQGWHETFAREVAVKFLTASTGNSRERFLREGKAAARIDHEGVIRILDAGESQGRAYLVLEFINGRSLGEILDQQEAHDREHPPSDRPAGSFPDTGVIATLGAQMARGLAAIHAKGIVHRDIKPDNVLVSQDGRAKIADLGLAKQLDDPEALRLTGTGMVVGTPLYVSPEGIRDPKSISGASDIYSLGATLYHLIGGRPPFEGKTAYDVMRGHLEEKLRPLRELRPSVPTGLAMLVEQCLAKNPTRRPTPDDLAEALENGKGHARSWRAIVMIGLLALIALTAVILAVWLFTPHAKVSTVLPSASLNLQVDHQDVQVRIDQGNWQALSGPLAVPPGPHRLAVRSTLAGPRWEWNGDVTVAEGINTAIPITLTSTSITPVRQAFPGEGLLFLNGEAYGNEPQVTFIQAGRFTLGRWSGVQWKSQPFEVASNGAITAGTSSILAKPDGAGWWRSVDRRGRACPAHRVVSWWEAERARSQLSLPEAEAWKAQGSRPEKPAQAFSPIVPVMVIATRIIETVGGRLPTLVEASSFNELYDAPIWAQTQGRAEAVGGRANVALLVLIPATR